MSSSTEAPTLLGCLFSVGFWLYCVTGTGCTAMFAHNAYHAVGEDPGVANILVDFILIPILKGIVWPFFL